MIPVPRCKSIPQAHAGHVHRAQRRRQLPPQHVGNQVGQNCSQHQGNKGLFNTMGRYLFTHVEMYD